MLGASRPPSGRTRRGWRPPARVREAAARAIAPPPRPTTTRRAALSRRDRIALRSSEKSSTRASPPSPRASTRRSAASWLTPRCSRRRAPRPANWASLLRAAAASSPTARRARGWSASSRLSSSCGRLAMAAARRRRRRRSRPRRCRLLPPPVELGAHPRAVDRHIPEASTIEQPGAGRRRTLAAAAGVVVAGRARRRLLPYLRVYNGRCPSGRRTPRRGAPRARSPWTGRSSCSKRRRRCAGVLRYPEQAAQHVRPPRA